ncbi:Pentatricopeptide repeat-containing protein [Acorus gramineus]|uniref:Pentatricopeptide repeat-containing protein n=1 Tax=Acorus gramineus TaxID=55184 RepID=A0AAV9A641_ACOGR|nr:Pentatricopeptide repeat-containing protein [Acorus gramineus]
MGNRTHGRAVEIYAMVDDMVRRAKERGYAPDNASVLRDMEEEEKESALCLHSEKLAVAFGLLSTGPGTLVRVMKNLRICGDCHSMMKLVSEAYGREIVVRDRNRFHRFKDGSCSCNDFW